MKRLVLGLAAVLVTASLVWFGTGLNPLWPLMWFAPLPVLVFAHRASWWGAALTAGPAWLLGSLNMWHYVHAVIDIPLSIVLRIFTASMLTFTLAVLLHRVLLRRGAHWSALLALPSLWTSFEYLLNISSPHGTAGSLAYSQLNFLPFLQLASLTGPWGMSFVLLLFPSALAVAWSLRDTRPRALRILGAGLAVIIAVLVFGAVRLSQPLRGERVKVGLIASDPPMSPPMADQGAPTVQLFGAYADRIAALAAQGARVIVLPEKLGVAVDPDIKDTDALFQALADRTKTHIVVGLIRASSHKAYNEARIYAPGVPVLTYDKHHMLPSFESNMTPGTTLALLPQSSGIWAVAICKDMDFTPLSRQYGRAGAGLMLVPAWDFDTDRFEHGHMAVMRAVESGFNLARAAKQGYLTVCDSRGRILAETTSDSAPFATLLAEVPAIHDATVYLVWGDWSAWVALVLLAFTLVRVILVRKRPQG